MGGVNHQPCGTYLPESTMLSRCVSLAYAELEFGNIALEDIILAELKNKQGSTKRMIRHLLNSKKALKKAMQASIKLWQKMYKNSFEDLPTLHKLNLEAIGNNLSEKNIVSGAAWTIIAKKMKSGGFYNVLSYFGTKLRLIEAKTNNLVEAVKKLDEHAKKKEIHIILEKNLQNNIKKIFADLYTSWANFHQEFLASSILSTELWYAFNGHQSLCDKNILLKIA